MEFCLFRFVIFSLFFPLFLYSAKTNQYEITVKGKKSKKDTFSSSSFKIYAKDIEKKQAKTLKDVMKNVPGVFVLEEGNSGSNVFFSIRGMRSNHTLAVFDGAVLLNPIQPSGGYNFVGFPVEELASVEILKGPHPVLFGSGAMGGVILLKSKNGFFRKNLFFNVSGGCFDINRNSDSLNSFYSSATGVFGKKNYFFRINSNFMTSKGISDADFFQGNDKNFSTVKKNLEKDGFRQFAISSKVGFKRGEVFKFYLFSMFRQGKKDIDDGPGAEHDDLNRTLFSKEFLTQSTLMMSLFSGFWKQDLNFSFYFSSLSDDDPKDFGKVAGNFKSDFLGYRIFSKWNNVLTFSRYYTLNFGIDSSFDFGKGSYFDTTKTIPLDISFNPDVFDKFFDFFVYNSVSPFKFLTLFSGIRLENSFYSVSLLDEKTNELQPPQNRTHHEPVYSVGFALFTPFSSKIHSRFAKGFLVPSFFQRYSRFANIQKELLPETSYGIDAGITQYFFKKRVLFDATWFFEKVYDMIGLTKNNMFENRYRVYNQGLEFELKTKSFYGFSFLGSYTFIFDMNEYKLLKWNGDTYKKQFDVLRRPKNSWGFALNYALKRKLNINLNGQYVGKRLDIVVNYPKTPYNFELSPFFLLNLAVLWNFDKNMAFSLKIDNLLNNQNYQFVSEYASPGLSFFMGLKVKI